MHIYSHIYLTDYNLKLKTVYPSRCYLLYFAKEKNRLRSVKVTWPEAAPNECL